VQDQEGVRRYGKRSPRHSFARFLEVQRFSGRRSAAAAPPTATIQTRSRALGAR